MTEKDVLIHAPDESLDHKRAGEVPRDETPYWEVQGEPQRTGPGRHAWFEQGGEIVATGYITDIEDGRIWFTPLEAVKRTPPTNATARGFKYIDPLERHFPKEGPGNYFGNCVVCDCDESEFKDGIVLGELTLGDVNYDRMDVGLGPVCSRSCMLELGYDVLPHRELGTLTIADRFRYSAGER